MWERSDSKNQNQTRAYYQYLLVLFGIYFLSSSVKLLFKYIQWVWLLYVQSGWQGPTKLLFFAVNDVIYHQHFGLLTYTVFGSIHISFVSNSVHFDSCTHWAFVRWILRQNILSKHLIVCPWYLFEHYGGKKLFGFIWL